ncbi:MAG TPA: YvcK family protein, partial [Desulfocapsa sulfexigens]|nr:YvcK family protein [Desulfocapsa sulfexigens]
KDSVSNLNVVVFGGGTGLSTIIGGDSRSESWAQDPFSGLKELFPKTRAIVCVTDDGGSTGELLKDLPLIALGDIRHVLLSSIQLGKLQIFFGLTESEASLCVEVLAAVFNYRFSTRPESSQQLLMDCGLGSQRILPTVIQDVLERIIENLFIDSRLSVTLDRPHCLGNLILASSIYEQIPAHYTNTILAAEPGLIRQNLHRGISSLCVILGADEKAVMPCTHVPAELSMHYTNGVQVTGEHKSGYARRGYPVDSVHINFCNIPEVSNELPGLIHEADIMIMAPGSLYSSLIPIFQVPGIADAVKQNDHALKILVSNLWVQTGETDLSIAEPDRKFHLSDLLKAYERNIPGGTEGLFDTVLCLSLKDVPATVIQSYAVEGKIPIYLDREKVREQGVAALECGIYSSSALREHGVIRHDPHQFALVVRTLWATASLSKKNKPDKSTIKTQSGKQKFLASMQIPCVRYDKIEEYLSRIFIDLSGRSKERDQDFREVLQQILWNHKDIPLSHLQFVKGVQCIPDKDWQRNQNWDKVFSFFDPTDSFIKIREDQFDSKADLEVAFLVALGQGLLGNYAKDKEIRDVVPEGISMGKAYHLRLNIGSKRNCYFSEEDLREYLILARMVPDPADPNHFTRLVNGNEGFTPPGLLMGLIYAWYLDNRFASHIEYKMAVMRIDHSDLIPEQIRMKSRREKLTVFFREVVFCH